VNEGLAVLFLLLVAVCAMLAVASLLTPKAAGLLRQKTRLRGFLAWLGLGLVFFVGTLVCVPKDGSSVFKTPPQVAQVPAPAPTPKVDAPSPKVEAPKAESPKAETSTPAAKAEPSKVETVKPAAKEASIQLVGFKEVSVENTSTGNRRRAQVMLVLANPDDKVTPEGLASTCMGAAKFYAEQYGLQALSVFIDDVPGGDWRSMRLANCSYSPDRGGWSGDQNWLWENVQAAPRGTTKIERQIKKLWVQWRNKFQVNGATDKEALSAAIAKKLKIKPDAVTLMPFLLEKVDPARLEHVPPQKPIK
jgi:hypothetical protein